MMKLPKIKGIYKKNFPLSKATWFQTGGKAEVLFIPKNISDLKFFLQKVKKIPITIIGGGSNLLVRDKGRTNEMKKRNEQAPSSIAASSSSLGIVKKNCLNKKVAVAEAISGKESPLKQFSRPKEATI